MNEFIQTDDTVAQEYESWSEYDPGEVEEMTSNEETIQIKAEDSYTRLQDKDSFYGNDVVRKAAEILSVTSGELRAQETRRERPTTAQKCPRSALTPQGRNFDHPLPERSNTGQKCPRQRNMSAPTLTSQMCLACQTKDQELQEARRKIAWLEQQLSDLGDGGLAHGQETAATGNLGITQVPPRPGKVSQEMASRCQMVELVPGSRIFLYQTHLEEAERKKSGTATARYLLSCFYSPSELMAAGNLTGKNDKKGLDGDIIDAIVGYATSKDVTSRASHIRTALRCKVAGLISLHGKKEAVEIS